MGICQTTNEDMLGTDANLMNIKDGDTLSRTQILTTNFLIEKSVIVNRHGKNIVQTTGPKEYRTHKLLGRGSFAQVVLVEKLNTGKNLASNLSFSRQIVRHENPSEIRNHKAKIDQEHKYRKTNFAEPRLPVYRSAPLCLPNQDPTLPCTGFHAG